MSRKELKEYFDWFQAVLPQRLEELARAVKETQSFEAWNPDFTPASLDQLGIWFLAQVETRLRTPEEIQEIAFRSVNPIEVSNEELTNRTFSIAMDIGMYMSKVFMTNHTNLRLEQTFGNKNSIDYGQPVLTGFGPTQFNPVQIMVTLAYGLASKKKSGSRLREIYDIWSRMIKVPS